MQPPADHHAGRRGTIASVAVAALAMLAILWPLRDLVPFWDGWQYASCLLGQPGFIARCAGHPAAAWTVPMMLGKLVALPNATPFFVPQLLFGVIALAGWARLLERVLPGAEDATTRALLVVAVAILPGTLTTVLEPNVDVAVLAWGMWMFSGLAGRRVNEIVIAGTLVCFSKETGVVLYFAVAAVCWWSLRRNGGALRRALLLSCPVLLYAAVVFLPAVWSRGQTPTIWGVTNGTVTILGDFQPWNLWSRHLLSYGLLVGVLQFQWWPTLGVLVGVVLAVRRSRWRLSDLAPDTGWRCVAWAVALGLFAQTSYRTYSNLRYFAIFLPFLPLAAWIAASWAGISRRVRTGALIAWLPFVLVSVRWSVDPVSRAVFGTFSAGSDRMFNVTSISHECCGHGLDPLAYSLQYTAFGRALDRALLDVRPADSTEFAVSWIDPLFFTPFDPATSRRTIDLQRGVWPQVIEADSLLAHSTGPSRLWYIDAPNIPASVDRLAPFYRTGEIREFRAGGASLRFIELLRRP